MNSDLVKSSRPEEDDISVESSVELSVKGSLTPQDEVSVKDEPVSVLAPESEGQIRRKVPKSPGIYVKGSIEGVSVWYTVDSGASRTVLSDRVFRQISKDRRPELQEGDDAPLEQAAGTPLRELGSSEMELLLDRPEGEGLKLKLDVTVADIKDDVLLGLDAGDTVDVIASGNQVVIDGQAVPCVQVKRDRIRKVRAAEEQEIPAFSEAIIEATFDNTVDQENLGQVIIEPTSDFGKRYSLVMAASLADLSQSERCKVRIMNPFDKPVKV